MMKQRHSSLALVPLPLPLPPPARSRYVNKENRRTDIAYRMRLLRVINRIIEFREAERRLNP